jgi:hypothetical protein
MCASTAARSIPPKSWSSTITSSRLDPKRHRTTRSVWAAIACLLILSLPGKARAEERQKILVMLEQTNPAFLPRLRAELGSSGFGVAVVRPATFPPSRSEIEQLAQQEGATAGLSLIEAGSGVEIWVVDRNTTKTVFREVLLGLYDAREAPEVIAIRVVETLRATLMEVEHPRAATIDAPAAAEIDVTGASRSGRFWLGVGGGAGYSLGGVGATGHIGLSLSWAAMPRLHFALDGSLTPGRAKLRGPEGETSIGLFLAGASFAFSITDPTAVVRLRSGLGAWASIMTLSGEATTPYVNTRTQIVTVVPHLDLGLRVSLTRRLGLGATLSGGISAPSASIQFAGREVGTWGRPLLLGNLLLETALD